MNQTPKSKIPEFTSLKEEAEFWDTHSLTDFLDETRPVNVQFAKDAFRQPLSEIMGVRFDQKTANALREEASKKGLSPTTLIRMWVLEKLTPQDFAA